YAYTSRGAKKEALNIPDPVVVRAQLWSGLLTRLPHGPHVLCCAHLERATFGRGTVRGQTDSVPTEVNSHGSDHLRKRVAVAPPGCGMLAGLPAPSPKWARLA